MAGLENWDQLTPRQRAVFFCCDGLKSNAKLASQKTQAIGICGQDIFDRYYLDNGNEARIKAAYDKRDPRLKQTIVTPYEPVDCFTAGLNGNENMIGKQLRWPLYLQGTSGGDFWLDKRTSAYYCYRKYVRFLKGELIDRQRCYTDFPLIRYTDVILQWAEALIELNEFTPAKNLIDQVRARAHIPGITIGDLDAMREAVRYERRVEFPVEAVNFFDEVRWGTYKETKSPGLRRGGGGYTPPNRPITRKAGSRRRNPSTSWSWKTLPTCESFWSRISRTPTASFRRKTAPKPSPSSKNRPAT